MRYNISNTAKRCHLYSNLLFFGFQICLMVFNLSYCYHLFTGNMTGTILNRLTPVKKRLTSRICVMTIF